MKIPDIQNILPAVSQQIFLAINPGRILKKQILKKFRRTGERYVFIVYTDSWQFVQRFTGIHQMMQMLCI